MSWARMGAILTAIGAFFVLAAFISPYLKSDNPPLAGVERVDAVQMMLKTAIQEHSNHIEARIVVGNVIATWRAICDAQRAGKRDLAKAYDDQLGDLQVEYMRLTGLNYPLRPCL